MRILHFCKNPPDSAGGIELVIDQVARGAAEAGAEVDILYLSRATGGPPVEMRGYRVHRARLDFELASTAFSRAAFGQFAALARRADVIHYHFPWPFTDLVHFAVRPDKPCVLTYHSDIIRQKLLLRLYRPVRQRFLASVDAIVATSPNYLATSPVLQQFADKVRVIPIGLERSSYPPADAGRIAQWKRRLGERFFLFVGMLRYYKGLHILLEAARGLDGQIAIVGAGHIENELKAQAARLGLTNVHFLGHLPDEDKVALLTLCHGVVFPSHLRSEAFGVTLLEGAMFGKPMISSEIGTGTTFINVAGLTGLVVPPGDAGALHRAMAHLLEHPEEARRLGSEAVARFEQLFTARDMVRRHMELYRLLVEARATKSAAAPPAAGPSPRP